MDIASEKIESFCVLLDSRALNNGCVENIKTLDLSCQFKEFLVDRPSAWDFGNQVLENLRFGNILLAPWVLTENPLSVSNNVGFWKIWWCQPHSRNRLCCTSLLCGEYPSTCITVLTPHICLLGWLGWSNPSVLASSDTAPPLATVSQLRNTAITTDIAAHADMQGIGQSYPYLGFLSTWKYLSLNFQGLRLSPRV